MGLFTFAPLAVFLSLNAFAANPVITGFTGASTHTLTGTPVAFGGFVGTTVIGDGVNTYNSCLTVTGPQACNSAAIYNSLVLRIAATHESGKNLIVIKSADKTLLSSQSPSPTSAGVTWEQLCLNMTGSTGNCDSFTNGSGTGQFRIVVDKNNNGAVDADENETADFTVRVIRAPVSPGADVSTATEGLSSFIPYPGDEKIYIEDIVAVNNSLTFSSYPSKAEKVMVFMSPNNMTEAVPNAGLEPKPLNISDGMSLDDSVVDGLTNGQLYFFRIGLVDEANNTVFMFPDGNNTDCNSGLPACPYASTPDEVVGLLTEDLNCFVATAAYGSSLEPKLKTFREFRYKQLLPHQWGRAFVKSYYKYGPYLARFLHDKPVLRAGARVLLWPAYGFSRVALSYGIYPALIFTFSILALLFTVPFIWVRK